VNGTERVHGLAEPAASVDVGSGLRVAVDLRRRHGLPIHTAVVVCGAGVPGKLHAGFNVRVAVDESYYQLLTCVDKKGENHVVIGNEIESGKMANGETGYRVTEEGAQAGAVGVEIEHRKFSNAWMRETLGHDVYQDQTVWEYVKYPVYGSLPFLAGLLFFAVRRTGSASLSSSMGAGCAGRSW